MAAILRLTGPGWQRFNEGEKECTSEKRQGQFSIFGAIEEKRCDEISRICTEQEKSSGHVWARLRELFEGMKRVEKNLAELAAGLSTGLAQEMQKGSRQL